MNINDIEIISVLIFFNIKMAYCETHIRMILSPKVKQIYFIVGPVGIDIYSAISL